MDKETIDKAAMEYSGLTDNSKDTNARERGCLCIAFSDGAHWRINSVWHKKCDIPQPFLPCLVELREGRNGEENRYVVARRSEYEWIELTHYEHSQVHRWAYVSDLLPGIGKEDDR